MLWCSRVVERAPVRAITFCLLGLTNPGEVVAEFARAFAGLSERRGGADSFKRGGSKSGAGIGYAVNSRFLAKMRSEQTWAPTWKVRVPASAKALRR